MSKFITTLLRFLIFSLLVYISMVIIWAHSEYPSFVKKNIWTEINIKAIDSLGNVDSRGHMFSRIKELKNTKNIDILFIGSSQAYRGFDTRIFSKAGYKTFNLGSSNQTPLQSELLLKKYLNQLKPKKVIYAVYPEVFSVDGIESTVDLITNDQVGWSMISLVSKLKNLKLTNTLIYATYRDAFKLNNDFKEPIKKGNDTYVYGGFVEKELSFFKHGQFRKNTWKFNLSQFKAFERSIKYIHKKNIELIIIQTPTPKAFYESQTTNQYFNKKMNNYGNYYNFNEYLHLDDSLHFYDAFHLNQQGVEILDKKTIELLQ